MLARAAPETTPEVSVVVNEKQEYLFELQVHRSPSKSSRERCTDAVEKTFAELQAGYTSPDEACRSAPPSRSAGSEVHTEISLEEVLSTFDEIVVEQRAERVLEDMSEYYNSIRQQERPRPPLVALDEVSHLEVVTQFQDFKVHSLDDRHRCGNLIGTCGFDLNFPMFQFCTSEVSQPSPLDSCEDSGTWPIPSTESEVISIDV